MCSFQGTFFDCLTSHGIQEVFLYLITRNTFLNKLSYYLIWQPPTLPYRYQYSTIGRLRLNHRVRNGNGCVP